MVQATVDTYGQLDFALNSAGISGSMSLTAKCEDEQWHRIMDINLNGLWYCMKHEINYMLTQGQGAIVNISSVAGLISIPREWHPCWPFGTTRGGRGGGGLSLLRAGRLCCGPHAHIGWGNLCSLE